MGFQEGERKRRQSPQNLRTVLQGLSGCREPVEALLSSYLSLHQQSECVWPREVKAAVGGGSEFFSESESEGKTQCRGAIDWGAAQLRFHNFHAPIAPLLQQPLTPQEEDFFRTIEEMRCAILMAWQFRGARFNLHNWLCEQSTEKDPSLSLSAFPSPRHSALALWQEAVGHAFPPIPGSQLLEACQTLLEERVKGACASLAAAVFNQEEFAERVWILLKNLGIFEDASEALEKEKKKGAAEEKAPSQGKVPSSERTEYAAPDAKEIQAGEEEAGESESAGREAGPNFFQAFQEGETPKGGRGMSFLREVMEVPPYRVFTSAFDEVVSALDLCNAEERARLSTILSKELARSGHSVLRLANRLQRHLMAQQRASWSRDHALGLLDPARLTRIITDPTAPLIFRRVQNTPLRDTVVTLLLDNSGSMRGRPILLAIQCVSLLSRALERCGVRVEILGFTTRFWKGGMPYTLWNKQGKPADPGRMNAIRHIVYKSADRSWREIQSVLCVMLQEGILKENIDGEALVWAHTRLLRRPESRRILIMISDGAPLDDCTLSLNGQDYLERHLQAVIHHIERHSPVELLAVGIGHDVRRSYKRAVTVFRPEDLAGALADQFVALFQEQKK